MRTPEQIIDSLDDNEKILLNRVLEIEKQYQHISKLSGPRIKEISDKIVKEIEKVIEE